MNRIVLLILFITILSISAVSAETDASQTSASVPSAEVKIQKYGNHAVASVKPSSLPEHCYIILSVYNGIDCENVEIRKFQNKTENFTIPNTADRVKVMLWDDLNGIKPVSEAKTVDMTPATSAEKNVEKIAAKLRTAKNPNVITYKTENNEPRAVIWTKGINAPLLSEFEKEVDITDPSYAFLYAGHDKGSGWYDANKSLPQEDGADANMCYAAVSANQLHWWLDQNADNIDAYLSRLTANEMTADEQAKLARLDELRHSYTRPSRSGIYELFRLYFESPYYAYNADLLDDFFINGYQVNTAGKVNSPNFFSWDPRGGFFYGVFEKNILTMRLSAGDYAAFKRDIIYYMKDGQSIGIIHGTPTYGVTHIITLWGVELDANNEITALYVTDSDDYDQPEIGMKRMLLKKNSSGYPIITTKLDGNDTGAKILEFVTLSLGNDYWN